MINKMINRLMMDTTAFRQTCSCANSRPKSSLASPEGPLLDTTSNVVTGETKDGVTPALTDDAETVTMDSDGGGGVVCTCWRCRTSLSP